jgi:hypothetical protein
MRSVLPPAVVDARLESHMELSNLNPFLRERVLSQNARANPVVH